MTRARRRQRGQGIVEFTLLFVLLTLVALILFQVSVLVANKFDFNHVAAYAARLWEVKGASAAPAASFEEAIFRRPGQYRGAWDFTQAKEEGDGVRFEGTIAVWGLFAPVFDSPSDLMPPGTVPVETFISVEQEEDLLAEDPDRYDNDREVN